MKNIKIDGELFEVADKVFDLITQIGDQKEDAIKQRDVHVRIVERQSKMMNNAKYLLSAIQSGSVVEVTQDSLYDVATKIVQDQKMRFDSEAKHGLMRFLMDNWTELSVLKCNCGKGLISYEAVRSTQRLQCNECSTTNPLNK